MSAPVEVRRVTPQDWQELRALRLEALADTPIGFLETLTAAQALPDENWQARAIRGAVGGDSFQVLAWDGDRTVGTCVSFVREDVAWLAAVYISPPARGQGLLAALLEPCVAWAREQRSPVLRLEVHEDNPRARTAYERLGFVDTGRRLPYTLPPGGEELVMERPL